MRSWRKQIGALLLALLTAGAGAAIEPGTCLTISVSEDTLIFADNFESGDLIAWNPGAAPQFPATKVLDLDFEVAFGEGFAGDHSHHFLIVHHQDPLARTLRFLGHR